MIRARARSMTRDTAIQTQLGYAVQLSSHIAGDVLVAEGANETSVQYIVEVPPAQLRDMKRANRSRSRAHA
jgi:hypothetical protein